MQPLAWTADAPGGSGAQNLNALRTLIVAHWAVEWAARGIAPVPAPFQIAPAVCFAMAAGALACCAFTFTRHARLACAIALLPALYGCFTVFPFLPNHTALATCVLALLALLDTDGEEGELLLQAVRWITVLVFVWAGLQNC